MRLTHFVTAAFLLSACSPSSAQPAKRQAANDIVATVGAASITLAEVDEKALEQAASSFGNVKLSQALYEARRAAVEELIAAKLLDEEARTRGLDRTALVEQEVTSKLQPVGDHEVTAWCGSRSAPISRRSGCRTRDGSSWTGSRARLRCA
jgi:hypothetical protein